MAEVKTHDWIVNVACAEFRIEADRLRTEALTYEGKAEEKHRRSEQLLDLAQELEDQHNANH